MVSRCVLDHRAEDGPNDSVISQNHARTRTNQIHPRGIALERRGVGRQRSVEVRLLPFSCPKLCCRMPVRSGTSHLVLVDDELRETGSATFQLDEMMVRTPSNPTGPLACVLPVLTPTSVPNPYLNPSANLVLAFTNTPALSIPRQNALAWASFSVTMLSVWCDECVLMWMMAAERDGTTWTARMGSRNSVS